MSIEADLKREMKINDYTLDIIEADELIAVWRYRQCNRFTRSVDFSKVPREWRYSAPPANCDDLMSCHVSYWRKNNSGYGNIKPAEHLGRCHGDFGSASLRELPSPAELDALTFSKRNVAPYISPILDAGTLALVVKDLGLTGKAIPKVIR